MDDPFGKKTMPSNSATGSHAPTPVILILAAGAGARFRAAGGAQHKLQAPFVRDGVTRTVLDHVVAAAQASGLPSHVITPEATAHHAEQGMGTSIATGVAATPDAAGWLVLPGDLPLVSRDSLRAVAQALCEHPVVVPVIDGRRGHPVGFGPACREALLGLHGDRGAREVIAQHPALWLPITDVGCILDVDTPDLLQGVQAVALRREADPLG